MERQYPKPGSPLLPEELEFKQFIMRASTILWGFPDPGMPEGDQITKDPVIVQVGLPKNGEIRFNQANP